MQHTPALPGLSTERVRSLYGHDDARHQINVLQRVNAKRPVYTASAKGSHTR